MSGGDARVGLVWAEAHGGVIGAAGGMPWHVPEDLAHFKAVTLGAPVVMGRKTWDSLPERFRPLPGRANLVVTRQSDWNSDGAQRAGSLDEALALAAESQTASAASAAAVGTDAAAGPGAADGQVWVIGGGELFREAIGRADRLEVTELDVDVEGDAFAPPIDAGWTRSAVDPDTGWHTSRAGIRYRFVTYTR